VIDLPFWTRAQAAEYVHMKPKTLANRHSEGTGPKTKKLAPGKRGTILYRKDWIDEWVANSGSIQPMTDATTAKPRRGRPVKVY